MIEKSRWALDKLTSADTKAFAKAEIEEHEAIATRLKEFGLEYPTLPFSEDERDLIPAGGGTEAREQKADDRDDSTPIRVVSGRIIFPSECSEMIACERAVGEECIKSYRENMGKKTGTKLDRAFVGEQLHAHLGLKDKVAVYRRAASENLEPVLSDGMRTIVRHIATLEDLMNKYDGTRERSTDKPANERP